MSEKLTAKEYAEKLLYTPEYAADKQADVKEKAAAFAEGYKKFMDSAKTEREATAYSEKLLTAAGTVNGKTVSMTDGNAIVPLTVVNNPGFDLPKTGGYGTWMFTIGGVALLGAAAFIVVKSRKRNEQ